MMDPSLALQTALRMKLIAFPAIVAPTANILDTTARPVRFPSIIIGEGQTIHDEITLARDTARVYLDIHCWDLSDDLGKIKVLTGAIRDATRNLSPWFIQDYRVVDLYLRSIRFLRDHEGEQPLSHAVVSFNALLQDAPS